MLSTLDMIIQDTKSGIRVLLL